MTLSFLSPNKQPYLLQPKNNKHPHERLFVDDICNNHFSSMGIFFEREVVTPFGYADIVTEDTLYEAKYWRDVKNAAAQCIFYNYYLKKTNMVILVFAKKSKKNSTVEEKIDSTWLSQASLILEPFNISIKTKEDIILL